MPYNPSTLPTCIDCGKRLSNPKPIRCQPCNNALFSARRRVVGDGPNPSGLCQCGCGSPTAVARQTDRKKGMVAGTPNRYLPGHNRQTTPRNKIPLELWYEVNRNTGCWQWLGVINKHGYGVRSERLDDGKQRLLRAHRWVYEQLHGPIPAGLVLDHRCPAGPNKGCVNPNHIVPCTSVENVRRGKHVKISRSDADDIRRRAGSESNASLAAHYGISRSHVSSIISGKYWADHPLLPRNSTHRRARSEE